MTNRVTDSRVRHPDLELRQPRTHGMLQFQPPVVGSSLGLRALLAFLFPLFALVAGDSNLVHK